jgi:ribosomal subunit interface protein
MNIHVCSQQGTIPDAVHASITARVRRVLERFRDQVAEVTVHLRRAHNADGGIQTHCQIVATVTYSQKVMIARAHADQARAIEQASRHLACALQDQLTARGQPIRCVATPTRVSATALFRR